MPPADWSILPIAEAHVPSFRAAVDGVAREKLYLALLKAPPLKDSRAYVKQNIRKDHPHVVALAGDKVVGWCDIVPSPRHTKAHGGVLGIGVIKKYRARGIGPALLQAALDKARAVGLTRVELTVREENARAIALYERFGFEREGLKRNAVRVDGKYGNLICMALLLE
jgi:ribosomal protein S18 acetylase RimI-like enzyme